MRLPRLAFAILGVLTPACAESDPIGAVGGQGGSGSGGATTTSPASTSSGEACAEEPCKLLAPQCGCAQDQACSLSDTGERVCIGAGASGQGEACASSASCEPGTLCVGYGAGLLSCARFCESDGDCTAPGACAIPLTTAPGVMLCSDACDLQTNAGCQVAGLSCQFGVRGSDPFTLCAPAGAGTQGALCADTSDCAAGFLCLATQVDERCYQWCDVDAQDCPGGLTCQPVQIEAGVPLVIGNTSYGACT